MDHGSRRGIRTLARAVAVLSDPVAVCLCVAVFLPWYEVQGVPKGPFSPDVKLFVSADAVGCLVCAGSLACVSYQLLRARMASTRRVFGPVLVGGVSALFCFAALCLASLGTIFGEWQLAAGLRLGFIASLLAIPLLAGATVVISAGGSRVWPPTRA